MSRTISDGSVDLNKFPANRVCQLAKKYESSKATTRHMKRVSGEPQATQINYCATKGPSYHSIGIRRKGLMQNPGQTTINLTEMSSIMVNHITRTKASTNYQCQTECHCLTIQVDVQSVEILPITMVSHVLLRNTNARHATNLNTSPVNVSKGDNIHNTKLDNPKLIKYTWITHMMTQIVIHQILVLVKIPSVFK